ncbi:MAG: ABC transporter ATPase [Flavobacteriales bacterium]|nr:ABC transporter ATPase [Flavobacteriales bacterium]
MNTTLETFQGFAPNSRTWVYQASRNLTNAEASELKQLASGFAAEWKSHGAPLKAAADVLYNRFLVMMVDEDAGSASGCSIDSSVQQIRSIQQKLNINLLDRMDLAYLNSEVEVETVHASKVSDAYEHGALNEETTVFNNMVTSKTELESNWRIPLVKSWAGSRLKVQG